MCLERRLLSVHAEPGSTAVPPLLSADAPSLFSRAQQPRACGASPPLRSAACCPVTFMLVLFHILLSDFLLLVPLIVSNNIYLNFLSSVAATS